MSDEVITREDKLNTVEELGLPRLVALMFLRLWNITGDGKANVFGILKDFSRIPGVRCEGWA
jgi:hypothetical protein